MTWEIIIPNFLPVSLNVLMRTHWAKRGKARKELTDFLAVYGRDVPKATGKRRVTIKLTRSGRGRLRDADGIPKLILDGLVCCGLLVDDSQKWCECTASYEHGDKRETRILLEDMP